MIDGAWDLNTIIKLLYKLQTLCPKLLKLQEK